MEFILTSSKLTVTSSNLIDSSEATILGAYFGRDVWRVQACHRPDRLRLDHRLASSPVVHERTHVVFRGVHRRSRRGSALAG